MFFGVHLLTGAAIGAVVPDLPAATGLGLLSHYAIDHLPHWNYLPKHRSKWEDSWKMALEPLISIPVFLGLAWWAHWDAHILVPAFAAIIPDLLESAQYFLRSRVLNWHSRWHHFGHWHARFTASLPILISLLLLVGWLLPWGHR
ncbi:MAG: hypothetical protein U0517_01010 [Candidatus Andersenbacteria bacterium]